MKYEEDKKNSFEELNKKLSKKREKLKNRKEDLANL